jgi:hypothetical protein
MGERESQIKWGDDYEWCVGKNLKEVVLAYLKSLLRHFPEEAEKTTNSQSS